MSSKYIYLFKKKTTLKFRSNYKFLRLLILIDSLFTVGIRFNLKLYFSGSQSAEVCHFSVNTNKLYHYKFYLILGSPRCIWTKLLYILIHSDVSDIFIICVYQFSRSPKHWNPDNHDVYYIYIILFLKRIGSVTSVWH